MKRVFICQPIENKTIEEIKKVREDTVNFLESQGYEIINKTFEDELDISEQSRHSILKIIGKNIHRMSNCDGIYCIEGWTLSKNCRVERLAALLYDIEILNKEE